MLIDIFVRYIYKKKFNFYRKYIVFKFKEWKIIFGMFNVRNRNERKKIIK